MWIDEIRISGFGKLGETSLKLSRGLNLILGPNETGKSTLQDFIWAILYGEDSEGVISRYRPWTGGAFGGEIVYHLEEGPTAGKVVLARDFIEGTVRVEGGGAGGETVESGEEGAWSPGSDHLGVDRNVFLSTCLIRQGETSALRWKADVSQRLLNLVESGEEGGNVSEAIRRIRDLGRREIGTEKGGVLRHALDRLEVLIREREDALYRREDCEHDILARKREQARWMKAERRLVRAQASGLREEALARERKIAEIRSLERQLKGLHDLVERGHRLPILDRAGLRAIQARREGSLESLARVETDVRDLEEKLRKIRSVTEGKEAYLGMPANAAEQIAALRALMTTGRSRIVEGEQEVMERRRELKLARDEMDGLAKRYAPFRDNFEKVMQDLVESRKKEASLETRRNLLAERESQQEALQRRLKVLRAQSTAWLLLAIIFLVGTGVSIVMGPPLVGVACAVLMVITGIFALGVLPRRIWRVRDEIRRLGRRISHHREEVKVGESVIRLKKEVYRRAGVSSPAEFRKGFERYRELDAKLPTLEEAVKRESTRFRRTRAEIGEDGEHGEAQDLLRRAGLLEDGAPVTIEVIDEFSRTFAEVGEVRREKDVLEGLLSIKAKELETLEGQIREMEEEARVILEDAGVVSTEAFDALCAEEDRIKDADQEAARTQERIDAYLGGATLEDLEAKLEELKKTIPADVDEEEEEEDDSDETKEELREDLMGARSRSSDGLISRIRREILDAKKRITILDSRIEAHAKGGRHLADIEADLEVVGRKIVFLKGEKAVLAETEKSLRRLKEEFLMRRFAPRLEEICHSLVPEFTGGQYRDLKVDEELGIKVHAPGEEDAREISHLSIGTQDQIYFILRHAIGQILSETGEPLPLILDETFAAFDRERRLRAMEFLVDFSQKGQVILFTCHRHQAKELEDACRKATLKLRKKKIAGFEISSAR